MARRSRAKKSALNQNAEPIEENKIGWSNPEMQQDNEKIIEELEKNHGIDGQEEIDEMINTELPTLEEIEDDIEKEEQGLDELDDDAVLPHPVNRNDDLPDKFPAEPPKIEKKKEITKKDIMALSKKGLRYYQRTGNLPLE
jgi:hypothetical protein